MAGLQEHLPPCPRKKLETHDNDTVLTAYHKFGNSFPSSVSSQDLRTFEAEKEVCDSVSSEGVSKACEEDARHGNELTKTKSSSSVQDLSNKAKSSGWQKFSKLWRKTSIKRIPSFRTMPRLSRRKSRSARENVDVDRCLINSSWKTFSLAELQAATNNFSKDNLIGKGGYAEVYKGRLPNGQFIAIKRLNKGTAEEDAQNFLCEIGIIAHINHPNTAKMIGYGVEGGTFLVLELSSLGSLGSLLHSSKEKLDWRMRYKIILGTADGLLYLHENCQRRIIHRDIKADNILLSEDFEPQICDFGLSKWLPRQWSHHNAMKFEGTFGYFAPEYFMHGIVDEKTDVFSFGVLLLEVITGRQALDESRRSLVLWAKPLLEENAVVELVDPSLGNNYVSEEMSRVILTAKMCIEQNPVIRPRMSQVVRLLKGCDETQKASNGHGKQSHRRIYSEEISYAQEYNSTKCLIDYDQHRKTSFDS